MWKIFAIRFNTGKISLVYDSVEARWHPAISPLKILPYTELQPLNKRVIASAGFETRRSRQEREPRTSESQWRHQKASRTKQKTKSKGNCRFHSTAQSSNFKNHLSLAGTCCVGLLAQRLGRYSYGWTHSEKACWKQIDSFKPKRLVVTIKGTCLHWMSHFFFLYSCPTLRR